MGEVLVKNKHIAFVNVPIASSVNPTLPLVETLVRRGHRVTYAISEPYISRVMDVGAEAIEYKFGVLNSSNVEPTSHCRIAINTLASTRRVYEKTAPDLIVYGYPALAARILAKNLNVPAVKISIDHAFSKEYLSEQIHLPMLRESVLASSKAADKFLAAHGVNSQDFIFYRERLNVFPIPREFEPCEGSLDDSCIHAGRCLGEQSGFGQWNKKHVDGKPTILVAPSKSYVTGAEYFRMCITALSGEQWHVILSIDDEAVASELLPLPPNFEIARNTLYTKILPYVDAMVGMGGYITASEALYHGVPMVMTSCGKAELEWVAGSLARVGIGIHLQSDNTNIVSLRAAVEEVLGSDRIQREVRRLQRSVRRQPGAEETVNRIEDTYF